MFYKEALHPACQCTRCHSMSKHAAAFIKNHSCFSLSPPSSVSTDNIIIYISFRCVFSSSTNIHTRMRAPTHRPTDAEVCFLHAVQVSALINLGILELFSQYSLLLLSLRTSGCLFSKVTLFPFFIPGCACWFALAFISELKKNVSGNNTNSGFLLLKIKPVRFFVLTQVKKFSY